jgi:hypothetical protein
MQNNIACLLSQKRQHNMLVHRLYKINEIDCEILLKVALNTINQPRLKKVYKQ